MRGRKLPLTPLEKRVPRNPRFANIESKIDTGRTVEKVRLISAREYLQRKDEPFFRIDASQLAQLLEDAAEKEGGFLPSGGNNDARTELGGSIFSCAPGGGGGGRGGGRPLLSPVKGGPVIVVHDPTYDGGDCGGGGVVVMGAPSSSSSYSSSASSSSASVLVLADSAPTIRRPFLLIDTREPHEYAGGHIAHAQCLPAMDLRQDRLVAGGGGGRGGGRGTMKKTASALLRPYRNREGTLIVLYDTCDRGGHRGGGPGVTSTSQGQPRFGGGGGVL